MATSQLPIKCNLYGIKGQINGNGIYFEFQSDPLLVKIKKTDIVQHGVTKKNEEECEMKVKHINSPYFWNFTTRKPVHEKVFESYIVPHGNLNL